MGKTILSNYQLQIQFKDEPEGNLALIGANTLKEIETYKYHKDVKYLYVWPQTLNAKRILKNFDFLKLENGCENKGCYVEGKRHE